MSEHAPERIIFTMPGGERLGEAVLKPIEDESQIESAPAVDDSAHDMPGTGDAIETAKIDDAAESVLEEQNAVGASPEVEDVGTPIFDALWRETFGEEEPVPARLFNPTPYKRTPELPQPTPAPEADTAGTTESETAPAPDSETAPVDDPDEGEKQEDYYEDSPRGEVDFSLGSKEFIPNLIRDYVSHGSYGILEKSGDFVTTGPDFDDSQVSTRDFWRKLPIADLLAPDAEYATDIPLEAVALTPAVGYEPIIERRLVSNAKPRNLLKLRRKPKEAVYENVQVGVTKNPLTMRNAETGLDEPMFNVDYSYDGFHERAFDMLDYPEYKETNGTRPGNHVQMRYQLPESVARHLWKGMTRNSNVIRALVDDTVGAVYTNPAEMNKSLWYEYGEVMNGDGEKEVKGRARPPYEMLPDDWTMTFLEPLNANEKPNTTFTKLAQYFISKRPAPAYKYPAKKAA